MSSTPEGCDETLSPIIFIPGFLSTNRTFSGVRYKISKKTKRKFYAVDLRNHGKSEYTEQFTLPHVMADLEAFMETENIPRAVLAGHSMGGRLALAMALKHPDKVEKLIVEDVSVISTKSTLEEYKKSMMFIRFLHHKLRDLPSHLSEIDAQKALIPHVAKFWPAVVKNFTQAKTPVRLPFYKDSSGKFAWEFNMDVVLATQNHLDRFDIDLSTNPVFTGDALLLDGENSVTAASEVNLSFTLVGPQQTDVDPDLPPVFLLHGMASSKPTWEKCLKIIANGTGRKVGSFDARNHGDSGWSQDFSYETMMEDLQKIMDFLSCPKVILLGHCMGGKTAIDFALKNPDKVEKLIVEDMSLRYQPKGERTFTLKYIDLLEESLKHIPSEMKDIPNVQKFLASYIHQNMPEDLRSENHTEMKPEEISIEIDPTTGTFEWKYHLRVLEHAVLNGFQTVPDIGGFRVFKYEGSYQGPSLFLYGTKSPYKVLEDRDFITEQLSNAIFKPVEGAGHMIHTDYPEVFCEEVIKFIKDI